MVAEAIGSMEDWWWLRLTLNGRLVVAETIRSMEGWWWFRLTQDGGLVVAEAIRSMEDWWWLRLTHDRISSEELKLKIFQMRDASIIKA